MEDTSLTKEQKIDILSKIDSKTSHLKGIIAGLISLGIVCVQNDQNEICYFDTDSEDVFRSLGELAGDVQKEITSLTNMLTEDL